MKSLVVAVMGCIAFSGLSVSASPANLTCENFSGRYVNEQLRVAIIIDQPDCTKIKISSRSSPNFLEFGKVNESGINLGEGDIGITHRSVNLSKILFEEKETLRGVIASGAIDRDSRLMVRIYSHEKYIYSMESDRSLKVLSEVRRPGSEKPEVVDEKIFRRCGPTKEVDPMCFHPNLRIGAGYGFQF